MASSAFQFLARDKTYINAQRERGKHWEEGREATGGTHSQKRERERGVTKR